jgi:hypothetical protein
MRLIADMVGLHSLTTPRRSPWSPEFSGLDYEAHGPTGTTALVCLRGSGSRMQTRETACAAGGSCCLPSSVIGCRGSKYRLGLKHA